MLIHENTNLTLEECQVTEEVILEWDYSRDAIEYIHKRTGLNKGMILADINSGTGNLARHFMKLANTVYCIEPDREKRQEAAERFWKNKNFIEINGTANCTMIGRQSVDVITCGSGISDCEEHAAIREFRRILKDNGWLILIENKLLMDNLTKSDPYPPELMSFYYPHNIWERLEYPFRFFADRETLLGICPHASSQQNIEKLFAGRKEERIIGEGITILHIGQPGY